MHSLRAWLAVIATSLAVVVGGGGVAVAAGPATEISLSITASSLVGEDVKVKALVTYFGVPLSTGTVQFQVSPGEGTDYGATSVTGSVVDGVVTGVFEGGLVSGNRTMQATYLPASGTAIPTAVAAGTFSVAKRATSTAVSITRHPFTGQWIATPSISHTGGPIAIGECMTYVDGVRVGVSTCTGEAITAAPGAHTVVVEYLPDPFGIPSDRVVYAPSTGTTTFTVPSPPVVTPPVVASPVATVAKVTTARKSVKKKARSFTVTVAGADGSALSGTVFLLVNGPQKVSRKLTFAGGRAVTSIVLRKAGNYTAVAKVTSAQTHQASKSPAVRFKVVEPKR